MLSGFCSAVDGRVADDFYFDSHQEWWESLQRTLQPEKRFALPACVEGCNSDNSPHITYEVPTFALVCAWGSSFLQPLPHSPSPSQHMDKSMTLQGALLGPRPESPAPMASTAQGARQTCKCYVLAWVPSSRLSEGEWEAR